VVLSCSQACSRFAGNNGAHRVLSAHIQNGTDHFSPILHNAQSHTSTRFQAVRKADTVVFNAQARFSTSAGQPEDDVFALAVRYRVGDRFLRNAIEMCGSDIVFDQHRRLAFEPARNAKKLRDT
jgi:hypothetical protein